MISHPVYVRHSVHYIYDIVPSMYYITTLCVDCTTLGLCLTSFALQKTSHPLYDTKPQSLWFHILFRHVITLPVSDIAPTVSLSSQPLHWYHTHFCMTSQPTYVWHHMHYIWHRIQCLCHRTTDLGQHKLDIWNNIYYAVKNIHYPCDITVTSLCHQTHCIESITTNLPMTSHSAYVYHLLHYRRHYILTLWNQTTIFMTSHTLYLTSHQRYFFHHMHCFDDITPTLFMTSHFYILTSYTFYCIQ